MIDEEEIMEIGHEILDRFYMSSAVNDTIWFNNWTTLYEEIMLVLDGHVKKQEKRS